MLLMMFMIVIIVTIIIMIITFLRVFLSSFSSRAATPRCPRHRRAPLPPQPSALVRFTIFNEPTTRKEEDSIQRQL